MPEAPGTLCGCAVHLVRAHSLERTVQGCLGCSGRAISPMPHVGNRGVNNSKDDVKKALRLRRSA
jgi:hypothetical protein